MTESSPSAVAFFGGAFDPPHNGHVYLAKNAAATFNCRVRWTPNGEPPHRPPPTASYAHRLAMCRLAADGLPAVTVADDEPPGAPRYTADTLAKLKEGEARDVPLLLIIGADAFANFQQWHRWQDILKIARLIIATRPPTNSITNNRDSNSGNRSDSGNNDSGGASDSSDGSRNCGSNSGNRRDSGNNGSDGASDSSDGIIADVYGKVGNIYRWHCAPPAISSTAIRRASAQRAAHLPPQVHAHIQTHHLYPQP